MDKVSYIMAYESPVGPMTIAANEECIVGLWFDGQKYDRSSIKNTLIIEKETEVLKKAKTWLDLYFKGEDPGFLLPVKVEGSLFKKTVSAIMCEIPFGETMTYGEIAAKTAKKLGKERMSAQAVGGAVGHNPISVIIPCHRVVGTNGSLTGYAGGMERKVYLLANEHIILKDRGLYIPEKGSAL